MQHPAERNVNAETKTEGRRADAKIPKKTCFFLKTVKLNAQKYDI